MKGNRVKEVKTDLLIIGAGPAGLGAALYAARAALDFKIVDKVMAGGQIITTEYIENYPGFKDNISGYELMENIIEHCRKFNISFDEYEELDTIGLLEKNKSGKKNSNETKDYKFVCTGRESTISAKAIIIATGTSPKRLFVEGESEYTGRGISYCATCDGALYWDKEVIVVGGGDTAVQEAMFLTKFAKKVYIVHRRNELRAVKIVQDRAFANKKMVFIWDSVIEKFSGGERLEEVVIKNVKSGEKEVRKIDGVFEYIGTDPNSAIASGLVKLNDKKFIITDNKMQTSQTGIFAAGDVRNTPLQQVITAVADGAVAATYADKYINDMI